MKAFITLNAIDGDTIYLNPLSIECFWWDADKKWTEIVTPSSEYFVMNTVNDVEKLVNDFIKESVMINGM